MSTDNGQQETEALRIDPEINRKINAFRASANTYRSEIGQMEIRKFQLLNQITEIEKQAQALMKHEIDRLGIPADAQWGLHPDGRIELAPATGPAQVVPPQAG